MNLFSFPMEQIGGMLRKLSLSGAAGNAAAIMTYTVLCLIPVCTYLYLRWRRKALKADAFLIFMSLYAFVMMYFMVNPGLFPSVIPGAPQMMLGSTFYSAICFYFVIRVLMAWKDADISHLQKGILNFLHVLVIIFLFAILFEGGVSIWSEVQNVNSGNIATDFIGYGDAVSYTPTYVFLVLQGIMNAIPYFFDMLVTVMVIKVIRLLESEAPIDSTSAAVDMLVKTCVSALFVSATSSFIFNILQLLLQRILYKTNFSVELPVFSLVFVLAILLFARYFQEYQRLKQDHDLFI